MNDSRSAISRLPRDGQGWVALLRELGVRPSKSLGQNFLVDPGIVARTVDAAGVEPGDQVVEVGPGLGILTAHLLDAGAQVVAVELDRDLIPHLERTFADIGRLNVVESDVLKTSIDQLLPEPGPFKVVANLPYGIASPTLMHFLEQTRQPTSMTVMMQREVVERLAASPPEMSVLAVAVQALAVPRFEFDVPSGVFLPPPNVESAVVTLTPIGETRLAVERRPAFFELVHAGFRHKRKQVLNSLAFEIDLPKDEISSRLQAADIDPMRRAQTLSVDEWISLLDEWERGE
jgi:16S rRNA (adenine1518-N6/adenine1519-N6)-dimethyltransferase